MPYVLPTFNLTAWVYRISGGVYVKVSEVDGNLAMGRRMAWAWAAAGDLAEFSGMTPALLVPAGSDIRDRSCGGDSDVIECPGGSGRWYAVGAVDDIGKGFENEHRMVTLQKVGWFEPWLSAGLSAWPTPIP